MSSRPGTVIDGLQGSSRRQRLLGRWWRRQSPVRQDRFATLGPLVSVLLFLAAIIAAFWYLRNEEFEREHQSLQRDTEVVQQQIRLRLIENQEQLTRMARELVTRQVDVWRRSVAVGLLGTWAHLSVHQLVDNLYVANIHLHLGALLGVLSILILLDRESKES